MRRSVGLALLVAAAACGGLGTEAAAIRAVALLAGVAVALGAWRLWGEATRPRGHWSWWLLGAGLAALLLPTWAALALLGIAATWPVLHHQPAGAAVLLLAGCLALLWGDPGRWRALGEPEAWWVGAGAWCAVAAAVWERDRVAARHETPTPWTWTVARAAAVALWTVSFLLLRDSVRFSGAFAALGVDVGSTGGRLLLAGMLLVSLLATTLLWRRQKRADPAVAWQP